MANKYCYFKLPKALEEIYHPTLKFWIENRGKVIEEKISPDNQIKVLKIQRGMSFTSNGEQYVMNFKYNEYEDYTYVAIEVNLSSGYGIQWLNPLKLIKQWARQINYNGEVNLVRKGEIENFFEFKPKKSKPIMIIPSIAPKAEEAEEIKIKTPKPVVSSQKVSPSERKVNYCTNCGAEVNETQRYCVNCGYKIRD